LRTKLRSYRTQFFYVYEVLYKDKNSLDAQTLFVSPENRKFPTAASIKPPVFNEFSAWKTRAGGNFIESFNHRSLLSAKLCLTARFAAL